MDYVLLIAGLALLAAGGDLLVSGAVSLAARLKLSPLIIGLTVVGFGTSLPELLVSVQAALRGASDIAVGNVVGSNIANILLILGLAGLITPLATPDKQWRDAAVMLGATAVLLALGWHGSLERPIGFGLVASLLAYVVWTAMSDRQAQTAPSVKPASLKWWQEAGAIAGGLAALVFGADLLINAALRLSQQWSVSEVIVGLTLVAVGTSLPELATSVMAAIRRRADIAVGNIVGSNIFNILGILGITAIIQPIRIAERMGQMDIPILLLISSIFALVLISLPSIGRATALAFLAGYSLYIWTLI